MPRNFLVDAEKSHSPGIDVGSLKVTPPLRSLVPKVAMFERRYNFQTIIFGISVRFWGAIRRILRDSI